MAIFPFILYILQQRGKKYFVLGSLIILCLGLLIISKAAIASALFSVFYIYCYKPKHRIGIVITDNTVETRINFAANFASHPYCSARIAVVDPAGISVIITAMALISVGTFKNVNAINTKNGYIIKRIAQ